LHLHQEGGIENLIECQPYHPPGELETYRVSIEEECRIRPSAFIKEAGERMFKLTGIRRSDSRVEVFLKRTGMKFRKTGGIPAKADLAEWRNSSKKVESLYKTGIFMAIGTVFFGCGSLRLGHWLFDGRLVFRPRVCSDIEWSQAA
jgi:hypothetical protein